LILNFGNWLIFFSYQSGQRFINLHLPFQVFTCKFHFSVNFLFYNSIRFSEEW
jgi:hypothetical protein